MSHPTHTGTLQRLRQLSHILDNAIPIPGTSYRIGIDPLLGLFPAGGDIAGAVLSGYIVYSAAQLGASRETLLRMVWNILLETFAGTIPIIGDFFDVAWKANIRNLDLLENHLKIPQTRKKADTWFVFLLLAGLALVVLAVASLSLFLITSLVNLFLSN